MDEMRIEYIPVDRLTPYDGNARRHDDADIAAIKASIRRFGFRDPIGVWGKDNLIVEGHGRLIAARECGLKTVPCVRLDDMTDDERRAYALAHNKTAELSAWDPELLSAELAGLEVSDIDMSAFGFASFDSEPLDLDDAAEDGGESDGGMQTVHCPKCGFEFKL